MPGPVSDSYDPEFGTGANAHDVHAAIQRVVDRVTMVLGTELHNIVEVVQSKPGHTRRFNFSEQELRVVRFALLRAMESV